jgi:CRISPR system Cascade subunit CasD
MDILLLRFDAPLMSFGAVMVDQHGPTERFPGLSLLTGLFANALGLRHGEASALETLQGRIEYAARWDIEPKEILDYHTVDLGQFKMSEPGWTTRGESEHRTGGVSAALGIHQRYRHYWANGVMTLAVSLGGGGEPTVASLAERLSRPVRPLFLGRKTCLPSAPLLLDVVEADDILAALRAEPPVAQRPGKPPKQRMSACWPLAFDEIGPGRSGRRVSVYDRRDWRNQVHTGRRQRYEGWLEAAAV